MILLFLTGCIEFSVGSVNPDDAPERFLVEDRFRQEALPAVDLLFVVDNTSSMRREQDRLADSFGALVAALGVAGVRWQAGVVTTDMSTDEAGWLQGNPWLVTGSQSHADDAFAEAVAVGTDGADPEAGFAAAIEALDLSDIGGPNTGFRRSDAALHVVFVSDSDDQSDELLGDDPVGEMISFLAAEEAASGLPARASAIVGDAPGGCASPLGQASEGHRYHQLAAATGGETASICASDFAAVVAKLGEQTIEYQDTYELRAVPVEESVRVSVDGARRESGWSYDDTLNAVVFDADAIPRPLASIVASYLVEVAP